ncbi:hypothetical protein LPIBR_60186 [Lacticaseibacillus paracasei]|nr:hypothetical protein LPIBR_60186 [Lacticaseibacillus paracasei]
MFRLLSATARAQIFLTDTTVVLYDKCVIKTKREISILWQKLKVSPWITQLLKHLMFG